MRGKTGAFLSFSLFCAVILLFLLRSGTVREAASAALRLCAASLIPSLFPFCVFAAFLTESGLCYRWRRFPAPVMRLLRLEDACGVPWLLGTVCGFPTGAVAANALHESRAICPESAAFLLGISANASPGFLIAVVGDGVLRDHSAGFLLLAVQLCAGFLTALLLRPWNAPPPAALPDGRGRSLPDAFTAAVPAGALSMLRVTAFVVFFSVVTALLQPCLRALMLPDWASALAVGALEMTNGLQALSLLTLGLREKFILAAGLTGFSGLCVLCQIRACAPSIPIRRYLSCKLTQSVISVLLALPVSGLLRQEPLPAAAFQAPVGLRHLPAGILSVILILFAFFYGKRAPRRV